MRRLLYLVVLAALLAPAFAQATNEAGKLRIAASQYEIIGVLLQKQEYSQVLPEYKKILNLQLAEANELPLVKGTAKIVETLMQATQTAVALQLLDAALPKMKTPLSKYSLLMTKAKVLKDSGRPAEAIEVYRKAQEFAVE